MTTFLPGLALRRALVAAGLEFRARGTSGLRSLGVAASVGGLEKAGAATQGKRQQAELARVTSRFRSSSAVAVFDAELKRKHRDRAARLAKGRYDDRLQNEIAARIVDRLLDCTRSFENILVLGGAGTVVARVAATRPSANA